MTGAKTARRWTWAPASTTSASWPIPTRPASPTPSAATATCCATRCRRRASPTTPTSGGTTRSSRNPTRTRPTTSRCADWRDRHCSSGFGRDLPPASVANGTLRLPRLLRNPARESLPGQVARVVAFRPGRIDIRVAIAARGLAVFHAFAFDGFAGGRGLGLVGDVPVLPVLFVGSTHGHGASSGGGCTDAAPGPVVAPRNPLAGRQGGRARPRDIAVRKLVRHPTAGHMEPGTGHGRDARKDAGDAGLRYVVDTAPGIRRRRAGRGFSYVGRGGKPVRDAATRERIRALAIPPAWTDVWICPSPRGHLQATGRDARGRKQYRYHPEWARVRDAGKFDHIARFGAALPRLRRCLRRDLRLRGFPPEKVAAIVVALLAGTLARIGNDAYARSNGSFGLTTLRNRHVEFLDGGRASLSYKGKGGVRQTVDIDDARLARLVRRCQQLPGQHLFQYRNDDGTLQAIESGDVNRYIEE